ncbi:hypothetical protein K457DRAFT_44010, partial [Linnemannia elongata AG-77]
IDLLANKSVVEHIGVTNQVEFEFNNRFLSAPFEIIDDQESPLTVGTELFYHMGFALFGLPEIKEMAPTNDIPVEDEKPSLRPTVTHEEELTSDFMRMKGRFLDAISKVLLDNENISKTSHCPVPEIMVYLPVPKGTIVYRRPRRFAHSQRPILDETVARWLEDDVIELAP